jgi:hypothetical protein
MAQLTPGLPLDAALAEARTSGFAEANPDRDVSGQDAADKIVILAWLAFGSHPGRLIVRRRGLGAETSELCAMASAVGGTVKLIAEAVTTSLGVVTAVEPVVVDANSTLSSVQNEGNLVEIWSWSAGVIQLRGRGAGGLATATALYADLLPPAAPVRPIKRRLVPAAPDSRETPLAGDGAGGRGCGAADILPDASAGMRGDAQDSPAAGTEPYSGAVHGRATGETAGETGGGGGAGEVGSVGEGVTAAI